MMGDLISREAAIKLAIEQIIKGTGAYSKGRNAAFLIMKSALNNPDAIPSVPAVPLDKLCEWLSRHVGNPPCPCGYDLKGISCNPDWTRKECWHNCLTNWMEEQNA